MSLARLRTGEWVATAGLVGIVVSLFLEWFSVDPAARCGVGRGVGEGRTCEVLLRHTESVSLGSGWDVLGRPWLDLLVLFAVALVVVLVLTLRTGPRSSTYGVMVSLILSGFLGFVVLVLTAIRVFLARPDAVLPGFADSPSIVIPTGLDVGTWVGLASIVVALVGLWLAVRDDRTDAPESQSEPVPARPIPAPKPPLDGVA